MRNYLTNGIFLFLILIVAGCQKNEEIQTDLPQIEVDEWQTAKDVVITESILNDLLNLSFKQAILQPELRGLPSPNAAQTRMCPDVLIEDINIETSYTQDPLIKKFTLDFGVDCDLNGSTVSGELTAFFTGPLNEPGTEIIFELDGFVLNGCAVDIKSNGYIYAEHAYGAGTPYLFNTETINTCITPQGTNESINLSGSWSKIYLNENGTYFEDLGYAALLNDSLSISIELAHGYDANNEYFRAFTIQRDDNGSFIDYPLTYSLNGCRWIQQGQLFIEPQNSEHQTLNYGYGDGCDGAVEVIKGGVSTIVYCP